MGGLSKRAHLINQLKTNPASTLVVDSGNILFKTADRANLLDQDILSAQAILDVYKTIGYDALAVGPYDLAAGVDLLVDSLQEGSPWISANLLTSNGNLVLPPWVIRQTPGGKIGILGLTAKTALPEGYAIANWQDTLPVYLELLFSSCDFIILLSNLSSETNEEIAEKYPQIHLIVSSDQKRGNVSPILVRNTILTQTHTRGKYLGSLNVTWPGPGIWQNTQTNDTQVITELLDGLNHQRATLNENTRRTDHASLAKIDAKKSSLQKIAINKTEIEAGTWTFQFHALTKNIEESAVIARRIADLKKEIVVRNRKIQERGADMPPRPSFTETDGKNHPLVGPETCRQCHEKQYNLWQQTAHSISLQSLRNEQQQYNIRCLPCHVTSESTDAVTETVGENLLNLADDLKMVGCEACHGPGRAHALSQGESPLKAVSEETCTACHTKEMDENFNFQEKSEKLGCLK